MRMRRSLPFAALLPLLLAGCDRGGPTSNQSSVMTPEEADNALNEALSVPDEGGGAGANEGALIPPAPGEPGGLPDDRAPLDEAAARIPTSVEASGMIVERWGLALSEGRYDDAARLWRRGSASKAADAADWRRYSEIHVLVGRPEAGGTQTARVPVQIYGRARADGRPFNLIGAMTLARNPDGQKGEAGQLPWLIADAGFQPRGTVRVTPPGEAAAAVRTVPAAYRGRWAGSAAACAREGDDMRLQVTADSLVFYESEGHVTRVDSLPGDRLRVTASYSGEGESWTRTSTLALSGGGDVLTLDGARRVRCRT